MEKMDLIFTGDLDSELLRQEELKHLLGHLALLKSPEPSLMNVGVSLRIQTSAISYLERQIAEMTPDYRGNMSEQAIQARHYAIINEMADMLNGTRAL